MVDKQTQNLLVLNAALMEMFETESTYGAAMGRMRDFMSWHQTNGKKKYEGRPDNAKMKTAAEVCGHLAACSEQTHGVFVALHEVISAHIMIHDDETQSFTPLNESEVAIVQGHLDRLAPLFERQSQLVCEMLAIERGIGDVNKLSTAYDAYKKSAGVRTALPIGSEWIQGMQRGPRYPMMLNGIITTCQKLGLDTLRKQLEGLAQVAHDTSHVVNHRERGYAQFALDTYVASMIPHLLAKAGDKKHIQLCRAFYQLVEQGISPSGDLEGAGGYLKSLNKKDASAVAADLTEKGMDAPFIATLRDAVDYESDEYQSLLDSLNKLLMIEEKDETQSKKARQQHFEKCARDIKDTVATLLQWDTIPDVAAYPSLVAEMTPAHPTQGKGGIESAITILRSFISEDTTSTGSLSSGSLSSDNSFMDDTPEAIRFTRPESTHDERAPEQGPAPVEEGPKPKKPK